MDTSSNFNFTNKSERNIHFSTSVADPQADSIVYDHKIGFSETLKPHGFNRDIKSLAVSLPNAQVDSGGTFEEGERVLPHFDLSSPIIKQNPFRRSHSAGDLQQENTILSHSRSPPYSNFARYLPCLSTPTEGSSSSFESLPVSESVCTSESSFRLPISASQLSLPEPPDGGWGWVIVFAAFLVHMITEGVIVSFGIFIEDLAEEFQESMSATSWVGSFSYGIPALVTPVSSFFLNRFGCRITCMLGALISAFGCLAGCFANSLLALIFTFGILSGLGSSLCMTAALVIVSMYFDERRATATGLSIAGTGVGALVFAPAVEFFIEIYTWRGTFMLMAGALLQLAICGALMRPVETNMERRLRQRLAWLEHFAKGSGLPPLSKTADYIDSDVPGRIKLLRDSLLAPRKSSGRAHAVIRMPNDVCSRPSISLHETKKLSMVPFIGYAKPEKSTLHSVSSVSKENTCGNDGGSNSSKTEKQNGWVDKVVHLEPVPEEESPHHPVCKVEQRALQPGNFDKVCSSSMTQGITALFEASQKCQHQYSSPNFRGRRFFSTFYLSKCSLDKNDALVKSSSVPAFLHTNHRTLDTKSASSSASNDDDTHILIPVGDKCAHQSEVQLKKAKCTQIDISEDNNFQEPHIKLNGISNNRYSTLSTNLPLLTKSVPNDAHEHFGRMEVFYRKPLLKAFGLTRESLCRALSLPDLGQVHRIRRRSGSTVSSTSSSSLEESCVDLNLCGCVKRDESGLDDVPCEDCFIIVPLTKLLTCCGIPIPDLSGRHLCKQLCDLRLCRRYTFDLFIFSNVLLYFWYNVTYFFMGVHALDLGFSETQAALLFSVLGGANMVGEIVVGFLADRAWVDALTLYLIMLLACGIITAAVPLMNSFLALATYASIFGFGLASNDALCTILLVEFVGLHHLTNALGMCFFCQGVANIIGPPTIGFIIDSRGSQSLAFFISGIGLVLSGLVVIPIIVDRYRRRRARRLQRKQQREAQQTLAQLALDSTSVNV